MVKLINKQCSSHTLEINHDPFWWSLLEINHDAHTHTLHGWTLLLQHRFPGPQEPSPTGRKKMSFPMYVATPAQPKSLSASPIHPHLRMFSIFRSLFSLCSCALSGRGGGNLQPKHGARLSCPSASIHVNLGWSGRVYVGTGCRKQSIHPAPRTTCHNGPGIDRREQSKEEKEKEEKKEGKQETTATAGGGGGDRHEIVRSYTN